MGGGLSKEKRSSQSRDCIFGLFSGLWSRPSHSVEAPPWVLAVPTGLAQTLSLALCPQAERVQLRATARAQTGHWPEPGPAADGAHVSDQAPPVGAAEGWRVPARTSLVTDLCLQADPVLPGPGAANHPPGSAKVAGRASHSQVSPARDPGRGPWWEWGAEVGSEVWVPPRSWS